MDFSFRSYRKIDRILSKIGLRCIVKFKNFIKTRYYIKINKFKSVRKLEIGPGLKKLPDFEALNIIDGENVEYIHDITKTFPFKDYTFDIIYASHVLEHVPWYLQKNVFKELNRILKPKGKLEIWVPDGLKIINIIYDWEYNNINNISLDGWYKYNDEKDVITWANGRIFTYGDGSGNLNHPNWHRTLFTPNFLRKKFLDAGFKDVLKMESGEERGISHGWISLGMKGVKYLI